MATTPLNLVAIGGGTFEETRPIDQILVELTGKPNPVALFISTASSDREDYIDYFGQAYRALGCRVETLRLLSGEDPKVIRNADLVYVGGGNTKMMLETWRETGVDLLLQEHLAQGKPAGGMSAGAICWFRVGNSDWPRYEGIPGVNTARLDGMGLVDLVACPHTRDEPFRLSEFEAMMQAERGAGVGLDDGSAIQIRSGQYRILSSGSSGAHRIEWIDGQCQRTFVPAHSDFRDLAAF